ncbi:MAG: cytochrome P450 [Alphaproteobacteria bacterium]|nr:MAG: cytochrome P450 [Alphaproteobacteria bacterium]
MPCPVAHRQQSWTQTDTEAENENQTGPILNPPASIPANRRGWGLMLNLTLDRLKFFQRLTRSTEVVWLEARGQRMLVLNHPIAMRHVLQDAAQVYRKSPFYEPFRPVIGDSLLIAEGESWRSQRRGAAPAFAQAQLQALIPAIQSAGDYLVRRWAGETDTGKPVAIAPDLAAAVMSIALQGLFGHQCQDSPALARASMILLRETEFRMWSPMTLPQEWALALPPCKGALALLRRKAQEIIDARRRQTTAGNDLLARLIAACDNGDRNARFLRDQVLFFMVASFDTTIQALSWTLMLMAQHPKVADAMAQEAEDFLSSNDLARAETLLSDLPYTYAVLQESMRLYPPVWTISRQATQDDLVPFPGHGRVRVPQGTTVMGCIHALHQHPGLWPHPERFDPSRFMGAQALAAKSAYFPFGGGPRICIGARLAELESVLLLAMLARRFEFAPINKRPVRPLAAVVLRPSRNLRLRIRQR